MYNPVLLVPARRVSGWVAETDPKYARAWLESLPLANSVEAAREIYNALYTLNRLDLRVATRLELMKLYEPFVATVTNGVHNHLINIAPPLPSQKRELAELVRRLHVEMAFGYKCSLRDLSRARLLFGKWHRFRHGIERAMYHLTEILCRSYVVYVACPSGVWREVHELYRLAESLQMVDEASDESGVQPTIGERYVHALLLGLVNPYNLPQNGVMHVRGFLVQWGELARIEPISVGTGQQGQFLIDLTTDAPPAPFHWDARWSSETERVLDLQELLRTLRRFVGRLEKGQPVVAAELGFESVEANCLDVMQRMVRAWGEGTKRRYARKPRSNTNVSVCVGLNSIHFFANGQRPPVIPDEVVRTPTINKTDEDGPDVAFIELDEPAEATYAEAPGEKDSVPPPENHRVERWKVKDIGPHGMSLVWCGDAPLAVRVGDLLGIQHAVEDARWSPAVVRWLKSLDSGNLEVGVELLAPLAMPIVVRNANGGGTHAYAWSPGLRLAAVDVTGRPATILLGRGICRVGDDLKLKAENEPMRQVRVLRLLERTGSFEQMVYADVVRG
jgi:cyclic-di-GMP-binding protein